MIAVLDFGLDFHHSALRHLDGRSRVLGLWDQAGLAEGQRSGRLGPQGLGWQWSQADLDADLASGEPWSVVGHRWDHQGLGPGDQGTGLAGAGWMRHGTHVAALAAGRALDLTPPVAGLAPGADLLFVSLNRRLPLAGPADPRGHAGALSLVAGVRWILAQVAATARRRGGPLPVIINLSLAEDLGPHDGSSVFGRLMDELAGRPGVTVVVAAGNGGQGRGHAHSSGSGGSTAKGELDLWVSAPACRQDAAQLWMDGAPQVGVELRPPGGLPPLRLRADQALAQATLTTDTGGAVVRLARWRQRRGPGSVQTTVRLDLCPRPGHRWAQPPMGRWGLQLSSPGGPVDGWLASSNMALCRFARPSPDGCTLSDLACHPGVISVGNVCAQEAGRFVPDPHSGRGPARSGKLAPDLAAVGVSLRMSEAHGRQGRGTALGLEYLVARGSGSSLSAAVVSGVLATMVQAAGRTDPSGRFWPALLTTDQLRRWLVDTASKRVHWGQGQPPGRRGRLHDVVGGGVVDRDAALAIARTSLGGAGIRKPGA